jgi:hypothetical protein
MEVHPSLPAGQDAARTRWGTHSSGAAFDRKKTPYLTEDAQQFLKEQAVCVLAGLGPDHELVGQLALGTPGFVHALDKQTCLVQLEPDLATSRLILGMCQAQSTNKIVHLGLFCICHTSRKRLCVQGTAKLLTRPSLASPGLLHRSLWQRLQRRILGRKPLILSEQALSVHVQVTQAFFHCPKYIKTCIPGLTVPVGAEPERAWKVSDLLGSSRIVLSEAVRAFLAEQVLCYLCTVDQAGRCAVNHRGGAPGFLVSFPPHADAPGGIILLPDYGGNGAFEALGNILETGQAALVVPNYASQVVLCISGTAHILEMAELKPQVAHLCLGAERVVALLVQRIEFQHGDWTVALTHAQAHAKVVVETRKLVAVCPTL